MTTPSGPLALAGKAVAQAGRYGDTVAVHMAPEELELLRHQWGEPTINPETGLPEYFKFSSILKALAPVAAALAAPTFAPAIGSALGASGAWAPILGSSLLGAGAGGIAGGGKGALIGGITGGALSALAPLAANTFANVAPNMANSLGITGGANTIFGNGAALFAPAAAAAAPGAVTLGPMAAAPAAAAAAAPAAQAAAPATQGSWLSRNWLPVAAGGLGLAAIGAMDGDEPKHIPNLTPNYGPYGEPLELTDDRETVPVSMSLPDWYTYGQRPEEKFFVNNRAPRRAEGGAIHGPERMDHGGSAFAGHVPSRGDGGQDDRVPAMLSDGEYVMDATTVADLGDGNHEAGAKKLDKMRDEIAKQKGRKHRVPPKAKSPLQYLKGVG
jgi:hypothetical protein